MVRVLAALWLALLALPAAAQTFPQLTGRVVDGANLLTPQQEAGLTNQLEALERQSGRQLVVATVPSLEGRTIEDYGYRLGRTWAIGRKGEDDGVILLVAPNERKVRVETGYGARVFLTDAMSSIIIRNAILPQFREGNYAAGIQAGVDAIVEQMSLPPAEAQKRLQEAEAQQAQRRDGGPGLFPILFWALIFFFVILPLLRGLGRGRRYRGRRRRRSGGVDPWVVLWGLDAISRASRGGGGGWGGGGGFGGFGGGGGFSGGGGSFGGGGASGSW